jgi:hypothetical protein
MRLGSKFVRKDFLTVFTQVGEAASRAASINQRIFFNSTQSIIGKGAIRYLTKYAISLSNDNGGLIASDPLNLLNYFRQHDFKHVALMNDEQGTFVRKYDDSHSDVARVPIVTNDDMDNFLQNERLNDPHIGPEDTVFCAVAWNTREEQFIYKKYPWVILVDATADTNIESRPLITICVRAPSNRYFPVMRVLLPNEQQWCYNWVFSFCMQELLGKDWWYRTNIIFTDGDSSEIQMLRNALDSYLHLHNSSIPPGRTKAAQRRCAFHIVFKSMDNHGPRLSLGPSGKKRSGDSAIHYNHMMKIIMGWLSSWFLPGYCESKEEWEISHSLFMKFLHSEEVTSKIGQLNVEAVNNCVRSYIVPHIDSFSFYNRKNIRCFAVHSNNGLEGLHYGYKTSSLNVGPNMTLTNVAAKLSASNRHKILDDLYSTTSTMNSTWMPPTSLSNIDKVCAFEVITQQQMAKEYVIKRINDSTWKVTRKEKEEAAPSGNNNLYPNFRRIREVLLVNGKSV